jgi:ATP-dependent Clp protease ATP-binding subunit ClpA
VSFLPLSETTVLSIVDKFVGELSRKLAKQKVHLEIDPEARRYLARIGYEPAYGARPLARVINERLKKPLADELLFGRLVGGGTLTDALTKKAGGEEELTFTVAAEKSA